MPRDRYASGGEILAHLQAIAEKYDLTREALFHTGVETATWDDRRRPLGGGDRPGRPPPQPVLRAGDRDPEPAQAPRHRGHGHLRRPVVPRRTVGLRLHRRRAHRTDDRAPRQDGGRHRHRGHRRPVRPPSGTRRRDGVRVPANALGGRGAGQPAHRPALRRRPTPGLAGGPVGQLPGRGAGPPRRRGPRGRRLDPRLRRGVQRPQPRRGHRLPGDGGAPAPGRGDRRGPRHGGGTEALVPVRLSATLLPRRVPGRVQPPQRAPRRLPDRHRSHQRAGAGGGRGRVPGGLHRLRHRVRAGADPAGPTGRPGGRRPGRDHAGREVGGRRQRHLRDADPGLPQPVHHARTRPAGRGDGQLHPAGLPRRGDWSPGRSMSSAAGA